ncbi:response regulator [Variovorax sp. J22R133]|uniref:response regulator n=1 Tax=Variovorax brevis TaxID=3053503 RepID=UPI00257883CD|nr:response regulator [Variovorax sp. J22R133]MDM0113519.1 response regulator [Variovorax sp. J22R133]
MATLKIPTQYDQNRILIADDEPEHLEWLVDFLEQKNFFVTVVTNVKEAVRASEEHRFRAYILDLNIPLSGWPAPFPASDTFAEYPGLHIVRTVRSQGNDGGRVVVYSAHFNEQITAEISNFYCGYVVKGRPRELKEKVLEILKSSDQTAAVIARAAKKSKDLGKRSAAKKVVRRVNPNQGALAKRGPVSKAAPKK